MFKSKCLIYINEKFLGVINYSDAYKENWEKVKDETYV